MAEGEHQVETLTVEVLDGQGGSVTRTVSVDNAGDDVGDVLAAGVETWAVPELVTPVGNLTDSGTIAFTDVDLSDVHSISAVTPSVGALGSVPATVSTDTTGSGLGGVVTWNYSVAAAAVEYLAAGEHKIETFTFDVLDGQGGSVTRTVSVDITGTNDAFFFNDTATTEIYTLSLHDALPISDSGTIAFTDVDLSDVHSISAVTPSVGA